MKKMRILSLALAMVMGASALTGCAGSGDGGNTSGGGTSEVPTLTWWTVGGTVPSDFADSMAKINEYLAKEINAKIDIKVASWDSYDTKMNTIVNSAEYFDLMFVNNTNYSRFVNLNAMLDITEKVQSVTPDLYKFVPENLWEGVQLNGKVYAVPTYKDSSIAQFWYFDDKYVQKYDIKVDEIKTMDDLDPIFTKMKEGEGKSFYPVKMSQGSIWNGFFNNYDDLCSGIPAIGVKVDDSSRKVVNTLEQPEIKHQFELLNKWYKAGIINPDANVSKEEYKGLAFGNAQGWPGAAGTWQKLQGVEKYELVKVFGPMYSTGTVEGSMNAVSKNSKYADAALKVLEFANTDHKFRDMLAYGIEGKDFEYVSENVVKVNKDSSWGTGLAKYTQATVFNMSTVEGDDPNQWKDVQKQNEEATESVCMGYSLDQSNIKNEVTNCIAVWEKYKYDLLTGAVDDLDAKLSKCIEELKAAGLDTIMQEAQKQINEFFK